MRMDDSKLFRMKAIQQQQQQQMQHQQQQQQRHQRLFLRRRRWKDLTKRERSLFSDYSLATHLPPCDPLPFPEPTLEPCTRDFTYIRNRDGTLNSFRSEILLKITDPNTLGRFGSAMTFRDALFSNLTSKEDKKVPDFDDDGRRCISTVSNDYTRAYSIKGNHVCEHKNGVGFIYRGTLLVRSSPEDDWRLTSEECTIHKISWENMKEEGQAGGYAEIVKNECAAMQFLKNYIERHLSSTIPKNQAVSVESFFTHETNIMLPFDILYDRCHLYIVKPTSNGIDESLLRSQKETSDEEECRFLVTQLLNGVEWLHRAGVYHQSLTLEGIMIVSDNADNDGDGEGSTIAIGNLGMCARIPFTTATSVGEGVLDAVSSPPPIATKSTNDNEMRMSMQQSSFGRQCRLISTHPICDNSPLYYISPEVYGKRSFSGRTIELWAIGVIIFIMLTNHHPWEKPDPLDITFQQITHGHLKATLRDYWNFTGLSENLMDLLQKMLTLEPMQRLSLDQIRSHPWVWTMGPRETLGCIYDYLKVFALNDSLDEDNLTQTTPCKHKDNFPVEKQNRSRMQLIEEPVTKVQEGFWNDNNICGEADQRITTTSYADDSMCGGIISDNFFDATVSAAIINRENMNSIHSGNNLGSSKKKRYYHEPTINGLRSKLCINEKRIVRGEELQPAEEDSIMYDCVKDEPNSSGKRRLTRGMLRDTKKKIQEEWVSRENSYFDALIIAMVEIEDNSQKKWDIEKKASTSKKNQIKEVTISTPKKRQFKELRIATNNDNVELIVEKRQRIDELLSETYRAQLVAEVPATGYGRRSSRRTNVLNKSTKLVRVKLNIGNKLHGSSDLSLSSVALTSDKNLIVAPTIPTTEKISIDGEVEQPNLINPPQEKSDKNLHCVAHNKNVSTLKEQKELAIPKKFDPLLKHLSIESEKELPISLSLFNWQRRQQSLPEKESYYTKKKKKMVSRDGGKNTFGAQSFLPTGIDTSLLSWDTVNSDTVVHSQPATFELPRKRQSYSTYGSWCSKLINCLQGKGRKIARHEFFYSDVDKAWFNSSDFHKELTLMGVPHNARLTRHEWSLVRRQMKKRPRRFSKKFIQNQYNQLQTYRQIVRKIQNNSVSEELKRNFPYEVLATIKVGATVTAYNKRAKILHRGTVLTHNDNTYLVQFERKDLGCDYCPDFEVASHGIPEILKPACDIGVGIRAIETQMSTPGSYGSLPYGTSYGPLVDVHSAVGETDTVERKNNSRKLQPKNVSSKVKSTNEEESYSSNPLSKVNLYEKVAEREALVKLICTTNIALKRKHMILEAIAACHWNWIKAKYTHDAQSILSDKKYQVFKDCYDLLQVNLKINEEALEACLIFLQIMYGRVYDGDQITSSSASSAGTQFFGFRNDYPSDVGNRWKRCLLDGSFKVSAAIVKQAGTKISSISLKPDISVDASRYRKEILEHRVILALRLLKVIEIIGVSSYDAHNSKSSGLPIDPRTMTSILQNTTKTLQPLKIPRLPQNVINTLPSSDSGFKALSDAVRMFLIECMLSI